MTVRASRRPKGGEQRGGDVHKQAPGRKRHIKAGVHTGWAITEAENEAQARLAVPPLVRAQARIVKLNQFKPEEVDELHLR